MHRQMNFYIEVTTLNKRKNYRRVVIRRYNEGNEALGASIYADGPQNILVIIVIILFSLLHKRKANRHMLTY